MYDSMENIEAVVRKFENCEYSPAEFTHARHLTVAAWYLSRVPMQKALDLMREKLRQFSWHHGKMGYHETITRFWLQLVETFMAENAGVPLDSMVNKVVQEFDDKNLLFQYYRRELVMSEKARAEWVEPDLLPLLHT